MALEFVHRVLADLAANRGQHDLAAQRRLNLAQRLGSDEPARHRSLAVDEREAIDLAVLEPGFVVDAIGRVGEARRVVARHDGIQVAVEGKTLAAARALYAADHVEAVLEGAD